MSAVKQTRGISMKFYVLTLFPDMILRGLNTSILGRAAEKKIISIDAVNIRDYTADRHGKADDYPYGGGAGMLIQAQPVYDAHKAVTGGRKLRTIYVTPQGVPFTQKIAQELSRLEELVFLCGHYEGIDQRVLEEVATDYISIGDYVLTGGELPAMVMIDAISRLVPGVLHNDSSSESESFFNDLLEYPQYSRPRVWHGREVPAVLLLGDHKKIAEWRRERSEELTKSRRPDLYKEYIRKEELIRWLSREKREKIHMIESLRRGKAEILYADRGNVLLYDRTSRLCMISAQNAETGERLLEKVPKDASLFVTSQDFLNEPICNRFSCEIFHECIQVCYPQKQALPVKYKDIRLLGEEFIPYVRERYHMGDSEYVAERIRAGAMYGAFCDEKPVGFIGIHNDGSLGMLFVEETHRRKGLGISLESYAINRICEKGWTPYGHVVTGNETSLGLQERLGLYPSSGTIWWLGKKD